MNPNTPAYVIKVLKKSFYDKVEDAARQHIHASGLMKGEAAPQDAVNKTLLKQFVDRFALPWAVMKNMEQEGSAEREAISHLLMEGAMPDVDVVNLHTTIERVLQLLPRASLKVRMGMARNPDASSPRRCAPMTGWRDWRLLPIPKLRSIRSKPCATTVTNGCARQVELAVE
jgi:hypothetical protein